MVSRQLALHAMLRRLIEVEELGVVNAKDRYDYLIDLFNTARNKSAQLAEALGDNDSHRISQGEFHYLEVLREAAGGPKATIPSEDELT